MKTDNHMAVNKFPHRCARLHIGSRKESTSGQHLFLHTGVDSGQIVHSCGRVTICDVEKWIDLHHWQAIPILGAVRGFPPTAM
jgi:hypothetical protein